MFEATVTFRLEQRRQHRIPGIIRSSRCTSGFAEDCDAALTIVLRHLTKQVPGRVAKLQTNTSRAGVCRDPKASPKRLFSLVEEQHLFSSMTNGKAEQGRQQRQPSAPSGMVKGTPTGTCEDVSPEGTDSSC